MNDLAELVRTIRALDPGAYGPQNIGQLLADVDFGVEAVKPYMTFRKGLYTRNLVFQNDDVEVAILCWDAASATPVHDHASQRCWMTSLQGSFDVENYERAVGGVREGYARLRLTSTFEGMQRGQPDYRYLENDIHRVRVSPDAAGAVSLHVYAKPIASCLVFDPQREYCTVQQLRWDSVAPYSRS